MTMLEKAARAACGYFDMDPDKMLHVAPGQAHEPAWKQVVPLIRAVLMAVREPDDSVRRSLAGGDYTTSQRDRDDSYEYVSEKNVADFCRDMIDTILNEGQL